MCGRLNPANHISGTGKCDRLYDVYIGAKTNYVDKANLFLYPAPRAAISGAALLFFPGMHCARGREHHGQSM